jgi:hypothetical protein
MQQQQQQQQGVGVVQMRFVISRHDADNRTAGIGKPMLPPMLNRQGTEALL